MTLVLFKYLDTTFYTTQKLLEIADISDQMLKALQDNKLMPRASYTLSLNLNCDSFFGHFKENHTLEYYAKGYALWLNAIRKEQNKAQAYEIFSARYRNMLTRLNCLGYSSNHPKLTTFLSDHIAQEWQHFLDGTYGLCTCTGLPEDIAAKEFAIIKINELCDLKKLGQADREVLTFAVNLLDGVSAPFAPHERDRSSRRRFVDDVREKYGLTASPISLNAGMKPDQNSSTGCCDNW
ncbi:MULTISPECIES: DUF6058 family natural product biosynthesis protein [unclassified Pseudoalteromonas]|uniref:DUF6058 family natural product biosynthesis protein n=1 Tax=unclassified Pseudoalteromonas TaxID=194690 RepID=UPI0020974C12|nr:DUF6058 family natural product biosynthesis protein [Pseudoalteromonas sp. XMcav2-N]MCO7190644.1 DUF6058 family natural product biosynthesis protein [Pseudoalteromonas sp. XMcav2-N]